MVAFSGAAIAQWGVYRPVVTTDVVKTERLYAQTVGVDRDRAHSDVHYVAQRLTLLARATEDDLVTPDGIRQFRASGSPAPPGL